MATRAQKRQVDAEAYLRYAPQRGSLAEALNTARGRRSQQRASAVATERGITQTAQAADPKIRQIYEPTLSAAIQRRGAVQQDLQGMPAAGFFQTAANQEAQGAEGRLSESLAAARADLVKRQVEAASGKVFAQRQADQEFASTAATLRDRGLDIDAQEGAFRAGRLGEFDAAATKRRQDVADREDSQAAVDARQEDSQDFSASQQDERIAAADRRAAAKKKGGGKGSLPGGKKRNTPLQHGSARDKVEYARAQIVRLSKGSKATPDLIRDRLTNGVPSQTIKNPDGSSRKVPGIKEVEQTWIDLAFELQSGNGQVSRRTARKLHDLGYSVKGMGYTLAPAPKRATGVNPAAPGANGQYRRN